MNDNRDDDSQGSQGSQGGQGGKTGKIGVRVKTEISRDDLLAPSEVRRLLQAHQNLHKSYVDKQKQLRKERAAIKEGRKDLAAQLRSQHGRGGSGGLSRYKKHPISNKAQFSGMDKQVSTLPTEFEAETNSEMRNDLENRYNYRFQPAPARRHLPKPRPC